jgi:Flp pilus assembly protein TadD
MRRWVLCVGLLLPGCVTVSGGGTRRATPLPPPSVPFEQARADGSLTPQTCRAYAQDFERRFEAHGLAFDAFNVGVVWDACGEPGRARAAYARAVEVAPGYAPARNNLAVALTTEGELGAAVEHLTRAVHSRQTSLLYRLNLAHVHRIQYLDSGDMAAFDAAERQLQTCLAFDATNTTAHEDLARLYVDRARRGDTSYWLLAGLVVTQGQARADETGQTSAELWNLRGLIALQREEPSRALGAFRQAIALEPEHVDARLNAALVEISLRDFAAAERDLEAIPATKRRAADSALALGVARRGLRDYEGAEQAYADAARLRPDDPRPLFNVGVLYQEHIGPNAATDGVAEAEIAKARFEEFLGKAGSRPRFAEAAIVARARIANIEEYLGFIQIHRELESEATRLEALHRQEEAERREKLLEMELRALEALDRQNTDAR